ncbi:MAG: hypothetical protein ACR2O3_09060 [Rhizobiaceae bacterium]
MKTKIHATAGIIGFLTILAFWFSTVLTEAFGSPESILYAKTMILNGMLVLIPAMIVVGASGMNLGRKRKDLHTAAKKKRMPIIASNGLFILVPAAFYLQSKALAGEYDTAFYIVQGVELLAGATNLVFMGLNIRDGRAMKRRRIGT